MLPEPFLQFIFYNFHAKSSADSPLTSVSNWGKRRKKRILRLWGAQYVQQFIYLQFIISKMHSAENRIQNALSASQLSNQFLTAAQSSHFKIPVNSCSLLAARWRLRGCCPPSHQIRTQSSQSAVSACLNSQHKPTHTLMGGAKYVKHGTWSWSRTNTCALAWRLKYTKYRIFNHVYDDPPPLPPPQTPFNESRLSNMFIIFQVKLLAQRFSVISAQETAAKAKEEHGEEQKPTQVQGECFCCLSSISGKVI